MLTKYILHIGVESHELTSECIRNWDQIVCAYSRKDFSGVVRSFSSKFEFVNEAYDLLLNLYLMNGVDAKALLTVLTITDRWEWEEQFEAPLDFSTITWDDKVLSISAIDNSLAALISANQNTKYEFKVGDEIVPDGSLIYDRITMQNAVAHELMSNANDESYKDGSVAIGNSGSLKNAMVYVVGDAETYENSPISFADQTEDANGHFIKVENSVNTVNLEIDITYEGLKEPFDSIIRDVEFHLMQSPSSNPGSKTDLGVIFQYSESAWLAMSRRSLGCFSSLEALKKSYPNPPQDVYAIIGTGEKHGQAEAVYFTPVTNTGKTEWMQGRLTWVNLNWGRGNDKAYCQTRKYISKFTFNNPTSGTIYSIMYKSNVEPTHRTPYELSLGLKSSIKTSWESRAKSITIDAFKPDTVAQRILDKITEGVLDVSVYVADDDARLPKTYILAGESIRGIPSAKLYSSFKEFCEWMQTVFGYTYYLGERIKSRFIAIRPFDYIYENRDSDYVDDFCPAKNQAEIMLYRDGPIFLTFNTNDGKLYSKWDGSDYYNDPITGLARKDVVYQQNHFGTMYYVDDNNDVIVHNSKESNYALDHQDLFFVHRDSLFKGENEVVIASAKELKYSVDSSNIYSSVEVGYDKQDYEAECGRDEWNFTSVFSTGISVSDKKLALKSKYRADCYGMEFLAQKRSKDTTDDKSDKTVFFVHCILKEDTSTSSTPSSRGDGDEDNYLTAVELTIDRSVTINGALSDSVFNGEYTPHRCLLANTSYLCAMKNPLTLTFASSDGNSEIIIDKIAGNSSLELTSETLSVGQLTFNSGDVDFPKDVNALYSIVSNGVKYRGYLMSLNVRYARSEAAKYKLIVKDIKL